METNYVEFIEYPAYLLIPCSARGSREWDHQYGDVMCYQFSEVGLLVPLPRDLGLQIETVMSDISPNVKKLNKLLTSANLPKAEDAWQGLARLDTSCGKRNWWLLTEGND